MHLRTVKHIIHGCQYCLAVLAFVACAHDNGDDPLPDKWHGFTYQLTLSTSMAEGNTAAAKSEGLKAVGMDTWRQAEAHESPIAETSPRKAQQGPNGGEDGDGRQPGWERETVVNDVTLLFYRGAAGINSADGTLIEQAFHVDKEHLKRAVDATTKAVTYTTDVMQSPERMDNGAWHLLILANLGDQTAWKGHTLGELREAILPTSQLYTQTRPDDPTTATDFVMTSESDAAVVLSSGSSESSPNRLTATVERMAARIDLSPGHDADGTERTMQTSPLTLTLDDGSNVSISNYYRYDVADAMTGAVTAGQGDVFLLTHVTPFNLLSSGEYLFKRVRQSDGTLNYLGRETMDADHRATNWVIDPWTLGKTAAQQPEELTYGVPYADLDTETPLAVKQPETDNTDGTEHYYTLTYAAENTLIGSVPRSSYATGVQLRGYYGKRRGTDATGQPVYEYFAKTYTAYIRHADPQSEGSNDLPMKHGIVRNNLYRLVVNKFTSLDVEIIEVHPWHVINVPRVDM